MRRNDDMSAGRRQRREEPGSPATARRDGVPSAAGVSARNRHVALAICGLLVVAVAVVFGQTVGFGFVNYDDNDYVYDNADLTGGLSLGGISWALRSTDAHNWHPLTWISYLLDYELYGLQPWGYHLTNLILHAAAVVVLFLVLRRMTDDLWPSAFVAAVFAVHPLHVESVAWVAERKDVLSGLLFMLTLGTYAAYARRPFSLLRYLLVVVLFALGLMAKPMLVTVPLLLLLLDYWPLGRMSPKAPRGFATPWRLVFEKTPLLALSAVSCVATVIAQADAVKPLQAMSLSSRMSNALVSYAAYVGQFFYPAGLAVFYPPRRSGLPTWQVVAASLLLTGVCAAAVVCRRRCPYAFVGWFWFLGMLVPVIGLVQVGEQSMADRYTYLPEIGLVIALAWGAKALLAAWPRRAWISGAISAAVVAALMGCAWHQTSYWHDSETLWTHTLECEPDAVVAHVDLGVVLDLKGQTAEAIAHYQRALAIDPHYVEAYTNLGNALKHLGRTDEAIAQYKKALEVDPSYGKARYDLGTALYAEGRFDEAIAEYHRALKIDLRNADAHNNLGGALTAQGKLAEAVQEYRTALEIKPNFARAEYNLAVTLGGQGHTAEAIVHYQKALELEPDDADARYYLGGALVQEQRFGEAIAQWSELLRVQPDNTQVLRKLAWLLATSPEASVRDGGRAVALAQRAARLTDDRAPDVLDALAAAYAEAGRFSEAVQTARKALQLAAEQDKPSLVESLRAEIPLYEAGKPFREALQPAPVGSARP